MMNPLLAFVLFYLALGAAYVAFAVAWVGRHQDQPPQVPASTDLDVDARVMERLADQRRERMLTARRTGAPKQA